MYQGQVDVYNLSPNTTYEFQIWTQNIFGKSETVSFIATTLPSFSEMGKYMSAVHLLQQFVSLSSIPGPHATYIVIYLKKQEVKYLVFSHSYLTYLCSKRPSQMLSIMEICQRKQMIPKLITIVYMSLHL